MKTFIKIVLILAVVALAVAGTLMALEIYQGLSFDISQVENIGSDVEIVSETEDSITLKKKSEDDFKVLMFTDAHLNGKAETDEVTASYIIKNITEQKPDLVIFGGDTISSGFNSKRTAEFAEMMEKTGVLWAAVLGNHESEGIFTLSRKKFVETFASAENCIMKLGREDIDGHGNYTVNILNNDGSIKEVFFFMDSGTYMSDEYLEKYNVPDDASHYDGVKESQVQWYREKHDELTEEFGTFKSLTVMHIPPYQTGYAENYDFLYGEKREFTCTAGFDSGLFDALKEKGSTQAVYYGHDHINDFGFVYEGILLSYIQPSGYGSYNMGNSRNAPESEWLQGCTLLTFNNDGTYEAERFFNHK